MDYRRLVLMVITATLTLNLSAQKIVYSEPEKDDTRRLNFEVIGKIGGNFLIYKNIRSRNWISVLDNDMQQVASIEHDYIRNVDGMINVDFLPYSDHAYMIYQYQKKNVVYCVASKIDGGGKQVGELVELDTAHIGFASNNKIYSVLSNDDKSVIIVFKIN